MTGRTREFGRKGCPRCGAELYDDMPVCYGCLYEYPSGASEGEGERDEAGLAAGECDATCSLMAAVVPPSDRLGMYLRTASVDLWAPVAEEGVTVGRDPSCDVVLHSPAVSRRHLRLVPTPDGMEVSDLGSTNPASYHGRPLAGAVVVPYGDVIEVCGAVLTMTGPPARATEA